MKVIIEVAECEFFLSKSPRLACFPPFSFSCSAVLIKKSASLSERFFLSSSHGELSSGSKSRPIYVYKEALSANIAGRSSAVRLHRVDDTITLGFAVPRSYYGIGGRRWRFCVR